MSNHVSIIDREIALAEAEVGEFSDKLNRLNTRSNEARSNLTNDANAAMCRMFTAISNYRHAANKCVFVNGPPQSGKDTVADLLAQNHDYLPLKFAGSLKAGLAGLLGIYDEQEYVKFFETAQGKSRLEAPFTKLTPRQTLIELSEEFMKPRFGSDIFGQVAMRTAAAMGGDVVFSDCGFAEELIPVIRHFGPANCMMIRLERNNCDFSEDSRGYIKKHLLLGSALFVIENNGTLNELSEKVTDAVEEAFV